MSYCTVRFIKQLFLLLVIFRTEAMSLSYTKNAKQYISTKNTRHLKKIVLSLQTSMLRVSVKKSIHYSRF